MIVCLGYLGSLCAVHRDGSPFILGMFDEDVCVVSDTQRCAEVHLSAQEFAVNPLFSCKVTVCIV